MGIRTELEKEREVSKALRKAWSGAHASRQRWKRLAWIAVLACPGSFVAGGLMLQRVLEWWW